MLSIWVTKKENNYISIYLALIGYTINISEIIKMYWICKIFIKIKTIKMQQSIMSIYIPLNILPPSVILYIPSNLSQPVIDKAFLVSYFTSTKGVWSDSIHITWLELVFLVVDGLAVPPTISTSRFKITVDALC